MIFKISHNKNHFPERPKVDIGSVTKMFKNGKEMGTAKIVGVKEETELMEDLFVPVWAVYYEVVEFITEPG